MASSDEEDIHQCGRCKDLFTSIDEYFLHKKAKSCQKVVDASKSLSPVKGPGPGKSVSPVKATDPGNAQDSQQPVEEVIKSSEDPEQARPVARRRGRPRGSRSSRGRVVRCSPRGRTRGKKKVVEPSTDDVTQEEGTHSLNETPQSDAQPLNSRVRLLRKGRSAPKKAWVEDYQDELEEQLVCEEGKPGEICDEAEHIVSASGDHMDEVQEPDGDALALEQAEEQEEDSDSSQESRPQKKRRAKKTEKTFFSSSSTTGSKAKHRCPTCDYIAEYRDEFDRHLRRVHNLSSYVCPYCISPFRDRYKLNRHLLQGRCKKTKTEGRTVKAESVRFVEFKTTNKILNKDMRVGEGDGVVQTPDDSPTTPSQHPADSTKKFCCLRCDEVFAAHQEITEHVKEEHPEVKPGICRFCGIWCMSKYRLWRHMISSIHDNVEETELQSAKEELRHQNYSCPPDGSIAAKITKATVKMARRCRYCSQTFATKEILAQHVKNGHPKTNYLKRCSCAHCGKSFSRMHALTSHVKVCSTKKARTIDDNSTKPGKTEGGMICLVCGRNFKQRSHNCRHFEALHTPSPQVPLEVIAAGAVKCTPGQTGKPSQPLETNHSRVKENTTDSGQENQQRKPNTCFVCEKTLVDDASYMQHMHRHRVWTAHPELGPQPPDLFEMMYSTNTIPAPEDLRSKATQRLLGIHVNDSCIADNVVHSPGGLLAKAGAEILAGLGPEEKGEVAGDTAHSAASVQQQQQPINALTTIDQTALSSLMHEQAMWEQVMMREVTQSPINIQPVGNGSEMKPAGAVETEGISAATSALFGHPSAAITDEMGLVRAESMLEDHAYWSHSEQDIDPDPNTASTTVGGEGSSKGADAEKEYWQQQVNTPDSQPTMEGDHQPVTEQSSSRWNDAIKTLKEEKVLETTEADAAMVDLEKSDDEKGRNYLCPYCLKLCETVSEMYWHKVNDHQLLCVFRCVVASCKQVFDSLSDYEQHSAEHCQHAFICGICNDHFQLVKDIVIHKGSAHRKVHNMEGNRCNICHRSFASREALTEHVSQSPHHFQCTHCGKVFKTFSDQRDHELRHTGHKSFLCDQCGATFINKVTLTRHRLTHKIARKHQCHKCKMMFNKSEHLRRHLLTKHSDEKPFVCQVEGCGRSFKRKDKLQEHQKMHSSHKPYGCQECGRSYRYKDGLRYHEKTHKRATQYICHLCQLPFPRPGQLKSHMNAIHQMAMKDSHVHPCQHCNKAFARPDRLKRHMENTHNVQSSWTYFCKLCMKGFAGDKSYRSHMLKKHPVGEDLLLARKRRSKLPKFYDGTPDEPTERMVEVTQIEAVEKDVSQVEGLQVNTVERTLPETIVVLDPNTGLQHQMSAHVFPAQGMLAQSQAGQAQGIICASGHQYQLVNLQQTKAAQGEDSPMEGTPVQTPTCTSLPQASNPGSSTEEHFSVPGGLTLVTSQGDAGQLTLTLAANQNAVLAVNQKGATPTPPPSQSPNILTEAVPQQQRIISLAHLPFSVQTELIAQLQQQQQVGQGNLPQITLMPNMVPPNTTVHFSSDPLINNYDSSPLPL